MARQVEWDSPLKGKPGAKPKYPWLEYTDGNVWECIKNEDFDCTPVSFGLNLHRYAHKHNMTVTYQIDGSTVTFQFSPKDE